MAMKISMMVWLCCILLNVAAIGQQKNIEIGELPDGATQSIPTVLISRKDPAVVIVKGAGNVFHISNDAGATWQLAGIEGMDRARWMSLLSDSKGQIYAVFVSTMDNLQRVAISSSKDNGKTWTAPIAIAPATGDQFYPSASLDVKGNLHVTWSEELTTDGKCESVVMMSTSSGGTRWSKPLRISQTGGGCDEGNKQITGGVPAVAPDGKSFIAWANGGKMFMDRSFANSMWLENDISLNEIQPGWKLAIPGYKEVDSQPQLMVDQSKGTYRGCLYLAWSDQKSGENDANVWFTRSNNYGDNWSNPAKLGNGNAVNDQYGPRMAVDQSTGYIYILFFDRGEHENDSTDVVLAYSSESGGNFSTKVITETPFVADDHTGAGVYLDITAHNGVIVPVWTSTVNGKKLLWTTTIRQEDLIKAADPKTKGKKK